MSAIKKFFEKKKLNVKFKRAGEGHRMDETPSTSTASQPQHRPSSSRVPDNDPARRAAADAALARMQASQQRGVADSQIVQRARMKREMEAERRKVAEAEAAGAAYRAQPQEVVREAAPMVSAVMFRCPDIGPGMLPRREMDQAIEQFLLDNLASEPEMTSALMIHTLNKSKEKVKVCIDTLCKYLDNIASHPTEEKYHKIRQSNKAFQERVAELKGTEEFLLAAGFVLKSLPFEEGEANFYVYDSELAKDAERLRNIKDVLLQAEPLRPELDRATTIFYPSQSAAKFSIPDEFYNITPEEMKREQQRREEASEKLGMLRTKAMRERDEQRELRRYKFVLIRTRFPDGILLQGVFKAQEKINHVYDFVRECLKDDWIPFTLSTATGHKLQEGEQTLVELGLAPAAVVNFAWDQDVIKEVEAQGGQGVKAHLKQDLLALIQQL